MWTLVEWVLKGPGWFLGLALVQISLYSLLLGLGVASTFVHLYMTYLTPIDLTFFFTSASFLVSTLVAVQVNAALPASNAITAAYVRIYGNLHTIETLWRLATGVPCQATPHKHYTSGGESEMSHLRTDQKKVFMALPELKGALIKKQPFWDEKEKDKLYRFLAPTCLKYPTIIALLADIDQGIEACFNNRAIPFPPQLRHLTILFVACYNGIVCPCFCYDLMGWAGLLANLVFTLGMVGLVHASMAAADPLDAHIKARKTAIVSVVETA